MQIVLANLNYPGIAIGSLIYFVLGAIWYSQRLFGSAWMAYMNFTEEDAPDKSETRAIMGLSFVLIVGQVFVLEFVLQVMGINSPGPAIAAAFLASAVFGAAPLGIGYAFQQRTLGHFFIDGGYHVAGLVIAAVFLVVI